MHLNHVSWLQHVETKSERGAQSPQNRRADRSVELSMQANSNRSGQFSLGAPYFVASSAYHPRESTAKLAVTTVGMSSNAKIFVMAGLLTHGCPVQRERSPVRHGRAFDPATQPARVGEATRPFDLSSRAPLRRTDVRRLGHRLLGALGPRKYRSHHLGCHFRTRE